MVKNKLEFNQNLKRSLTVRGPMKDSGEVEEKQDSLISFLREKAAPYAFKKCMGLGDFEYDQHKLEASLGTCEDRECSTNEQGHHYLG